MNKCNHEWEPVQENGAWGSFILFRDECKHCKCVGVLDPVSGKIEAVPPAPKAKNNVVDLHEYKMNKLGKGFSHGNY